MYVIWLSEEHFYGGRTKDFNYRWRFHLRSLRYGRHGNRRMQAVFDLHGVFNPSIVTELPPDADMQGAEQRWLDENYGKPGCVNLSRAADGGAMTGRNHTPETRAKMSASRKGKPGVRPSAEARRNMSEAGKRRPPMSEETRAKLQACRHTEETKARMSVSHTDMEFTLEHRANMSRNHVSKKDPEGHRARLRAGWVKRKARAAEKAAQGGSR